MCDRSHSTMTFSQQTTAASMLSPLDYHVNQFLNTMTGQGALCTA